jgi:hypothetical protein
LLSVEGERGGYEEQGGEGEHVLANKKSKAFPDILIKSNHLFKKKLKKNKREKKS